MYLGPHHFQVQSRYFEDSIQFAASALRFEAYGFVGFGWTPKPCARHPVAAACPRILPDGLAFHMPECDPLPPARTFPTCFRPRATNSPSCWPSPSEKPTGSTAWPPVRSIARAPATWPKRSRSPTKPTGRDEKPVSGAEEFLVASGYRTQDGVLGMPVARVMRDGTGHFIFDPDFIPPSTVISASERLMQILQRLIEILDEKSAALSAPWARRGAPGRSTPRATSPSLAPPHGQLRARSLRQCTRAGTSTRRTFSSRCCKLGGALCTFAIESHPREAGRSTITVIWISRSAR